MTLCNIVFGKSFYFMHSYFYFVFSYYLVAVRTFCLRADIQNGYCSFPYKIR